MKVKTILGVILLVGIGIGTYVYQNRYSFFKYLPAIEDENLHDINGIICDNNGTPFNGRKKEISDDYMDIYSFKDGKLDGLNVVYYKDQIKEIGHWENDKQNGIFKMYTEDGILVDDCNFKDGVRDGITKQFYSDTGKIKILANYKAGILNGEFKQYYPNEQLQAEATYLDGAFEGEYKEYYENGNIKLFGVFKNKGTEATMSFYTENEKINTVYNLKNGMLNGIKEDYYENGNLWKRQEFKDNNQEGIYEVYNIDGTPQLKAVIKDGYIIKEQRFNKDGTSYEENDGIIVDQNININKSDSEITITEINE